MRELLRRVSHNAGVLLSGNLVAAAIGAATIAINARALGPDNFAILAIVQAFVLVCDRFFGFDTWQPFISVASKNGSDVKSDKLSSAFKYSVSYDFVASICGGVFGLSILYFSSEILHLRPEIIPYAAIFVATLFVRISGAPIGILRLEGKFKWQAQLQIIEAISRFVLSIYLSFSNQAIEIYFVCFAILALMRQIAQWVMAVIAWKSSEILPQSINMSVSDVESKNAFANYSFSTWIHSSSNVIRQNADVFVLSAFGFGSSAGYYVIAQRASGLLAKAADAARYSVFPEISVLVGDGKSSSIYTILKKVIPFSIAILIIPPLVTLLISEPMIQLVLGEEYLNVATPLLLLVIAQSIYLAGFAIGPLVQMLVSPSAILKMTIPAFFASMAIMFYMIPLHGINGAGISQIAFNVTWFSIGIILIYGQSMRRE